MGSCSSTTENYELVVESCKKLVADDDAADYHVNLITLDVYLEMDNIGDPELRALLKKHEGTVKNSPLRIQDMIVFQHLRVILADKTTEWLEVKAATSDEGKPNLSPLKHDHYRTLDLLTFSRTAG